MTTLDKDFWENRYREGATGWDIGYPSTPLKKYIDQLSDKNIKLLIPGCGNAYEADYLHRQGFKNVTILDIAEAPIELFKKKHPGFPEENIVLGDFFTHQAEYDLILEQTFFCALDPSLRKQYVEKMAGLLKPGGKLAGLLFNVTFEKDGPPFGGSIDEYIALFDKKFIFNKLEPEQASIPPRAGTEVFIEFIRP
jgi:SAM-dependent methyltransferase